MTWRLINEARARSMQEHLFYIYGGDIAVADWSIRNINDPSTTDDGLMTVRANERTVVAWGTDGKLQVRIPVFSERKQEHCYVWAEVCNFAYVAQYFAARGFEIVVPPEIALLAEHGKVQP
jgi:hypothetical protein